MYQFLETIAITPEGARNLELHQKRVNRVYSEFFPEEIAFQLRDVIKDAKSTGVEKCRIIYGGGDISVSREAYLPKWHRSFRLVRANSLDYAHKYLDRTRIELLLNGIMADDIIIVKDDYITDSSYANLLFLKNGKWYTPEKPLLQGTMRQLLLDTGVIHTRAIHFEQVMDYEAVLTINAMLGFCPEKASSVRNILSFL